MAIPAFVNAGAGDPALTTIVPAFPASPVAGNIILLHHFIRTNSEDTTWDHAADGFSLMAGPVSQGTILRHRIYGKVATGSETGSVSITKDGSTFLHMARMYQFSGTDGLTIEDLDTNGGASDTFAHADCTTLGAERLVVAFVAITDDSPQIGAIADFAGETGGTWVEAVAEFGSGIGADGTMQLQTADMASAGTITGGSFTMATSETWSVITFALTPAAVAVGWGPRLGLQRFRRVRAA